jgi:protein TonB
MKLPSIHQNNLDELVFENRNKLYGAYDLRKSYDSHLIKAILGSFSFFLLLYFAVYFKSLIQPVVHQYPMDEAIVLDPPTNLILEIQTIPKTQPPTARLVPAVDNGNYQITHHPVENVLPSERTETSTVLTTTTGGETGGEVATTGQGNTNTTLTTDLPFVPGTETSEAATYADVMPEFPGGMDRLKAFLQNNLKFPSSAYNREVEGRVIVSFVVDKDGVISKIKIEKSLGVDFDEAAINIIEMMPKWIPGKQGGKNVSVKFNLPIRFTLQ